VSKKISVIAWIAAGTLALSTSALSQMPSGRIVIVDLNQVFNEYYKTPIASAKLKDTVDSYNKEQEDMITAYKKQIDELNKLREDQEKPEYTQEVREQKKKAVQEKLAETQKTQRDIDEYKRSHQQILEQQTQRMRQTILTEIKDVINKEARDAGYLMVLDKSGNTLNGVPPVVYSQDALDITDDIVKILNKNAPAKSAVEKSKGDENKPAVPPLDTK
jgi:Skp family chaperone for outer membrane proteins